MTTLCEGNLQITFPRDAEARKFDDPKSHGLSNCMKAVDFIVEEADRVLFIEIKDPDDPNAEETRRKEFVHKFFSGSLDNDLKYKYRDTFLYRWASGGVDKPIYYWVIRRLAQADRSGAFLANRRPETQAPAAWTANRKMEPADRRGLHGVQHRHVEPAPAALPAIAHPVAAGPSLSRGHRVRLDTDDHVHLPAGDLRWEMVIRRRMKSSTTRSESGTALTSEEVAAILGVRSVKGIGSALSGTRSSLGEAGIRLNETSAVTRGTDTRSGPQVRESGRHSNTPPSKVGEEGMAGLVRSAGKASSRIPARGVQARSRHGGPLGHIGSYGLEIRGADRLARERSRPSSRLHLARRPPLNCPPLGMDSAARPAYSRRSTKAMVPWKGADRPVGDGGAKFWTTDRRRIR